MDKEPSCLKKKKKTGLSVQYLSLNLHSSVSAIYTRLVNNLYLRKT